MNEAESSLPTSAAALDQVLRQAIAHHQAGQLQDAERLYRAILQVRPDHPDANHNLGVLGVQVGQISAALPHFKAALEANPDHGQYWLSYIDALIRAGQDTDARQALEQGRSMGLHGAAVEALAGRLEELSGMAPGHQEISAVAAMFADGRYEEAAKAAEQMTLQYPLCGLGWKVQGAVYWQIGRSADALKPLQKATALSPRDAEAHYNLGNVLRNLGEIDSSVASYRRALEVNPNYPDAYNGLGNAHKEQGKLSDAEGYYRRALELKPDLAEVHNNLAMVLMDMGRQDEAEMGYRRALMLKPGLAEVHNNLGNLLKELGRQDEAEESYRRSVEIMPRRLAYSVHAHLLLPVIPESKEAIDTWRERYRMGISNLASSNFSGDFGRINDFSFYLAYHNQDDKPLMEDLCNMFRKCVPALITTAPHVKGWQSPAFSNRRIRVGFLSECFSNHTIGKLYLGFIRHLDRRQFEVVVIHSPTVTRDDINKIINSSADKALFLPSSLKDQQVAIMAEHLDVLFYPDIGMSAATYLLAHARLAPVQAVSWGHPDTTGLDSMDYFVSSSSIEPPDADEHYTERLIRLSRLPCYYQPPAASAKAFTRQELGLPETGTLYGCLQSLFKFHPDFDPILADIAAGDPMGHILAVEGKYPSWSKLLKARWANSYPVLLERIVFLPRMPADRFMALMSYIDIHLDPIHFGSGNTMYEAMVYGTPIVTWPGKFMRGRLVAGCYAQMGIKNPPIANGLAGYSKLALALSQDPERCRKLRDDLIESAGKGLFADIHAVKEFELFLLAAVGAAQHGKKLPIGWQPSSEASAPIDNLRSRAKL